MIIGVFVGVNGDSFGIGIERSVSFGEDNMDICLNHCEKEIYNHNKQLLNYPLQL